MKLYDKLDVLKSLRKQEKQNKRQTSQHHASLPHSHSRKAKSKLSPKKNKQSPSNKNLSKFDWIKVLQPAILASLLGIWWSWHEFRFNNLRYQRDLVSNYIDAVQTILMDQFYRSEGQYPDKTPKSMNLFITSKVGEPKQVALFITSKAGTILKRLTDETSKDTLLTFLRQANIGFLPRSADSNQVETLEDISKITKIKYLDLLKGIDLSKAQLNYRDLSFAVLQNADLTRSSLIGAKLGQANLSKSRLVKTNLREANLIGAYLGEAILTETDLRKGKLHKANLREANLQKAKLQGAIFHGANLVDTKLVDVDPDGNEQNKAQINHKTSFIYALYVPNKGTKFPNNFDPDQQCMIPIKPKLDLLNLLNTENCQKQEKLLRKTIFAEENLSEQETPFERVNPFKKADLSRTNLQGANLTRVDFQVDFFQTNFAEANLREAKFSGAKLEGADFRGANLINTQFIDDQEQNKAQINHETSFIYALYVPNKGTKFPNNFDPDQQCMIPIKPKLDLPNFLNSENCQEQEKLLRETIFAEENLSEEETPFNLVNPFKKTDLSGTNLQGANLTQVDFFQTNLTTAKLKEANLTGANLAEANLRGANFQKAKLEGANFQGANLVYAQLIDRERVEENKAQINNETSFAYALYIPNNRTKFPKNFNPDQQCMIAIKPELNLPDFLNTTENCQEQEKPFDLVNPFKKTDLSRTNLQGANLTQVDFFQTNFAKANLAETNLAEANLAETNLIKAENLIPPQIKSACNWEKALYKGDWDDNQKKWIVDEQKNQEYVEQLKQDKASDPKQPIDCSKWN